MGEMGKQTKQKDREESKSSNKTGNNLNMPYERNKFHLHGNAGTECKI
jgi:hypothetical protein